MTTEKLVPKQVIIEATNRCNLKCKYCPSVANNGKFPVGDISVDFFKSIVDRAEKEFPDSTIIPWMNGEPFMHPRYLEMMEYLNVHKRRFYVTTNLTLYREDVLRELLKQDSGCYQLIISMDGLPDTGSIALARPGTDEKLLRSNLNRLLRLAGDMDTETRIAIKICERGQDWEEIEGYIYYYLEDRGIDYVCVGKPLKDINPVSMRQYPCQYFDNNFMVIRHTGDLVVCAYNDDCANSLKLSYGIVTDNGSLLDLYNGPYITYLRAEQKAKRFHGPCKKCSFSYTGSGYQGEVSFRNHPENKYYFHQDYYNSFFSKIDDRKPNSYYHNGRDL